MAHQIIGERFVSRGIAAWHGIGEVFDKDVNLLASEAAKKIAGDVLVTCEPLHYTDPTGATVDSGHRAVVRHPLPDDPEPQILGVVTDRWHQVSYVELAGALDELSKTYKVETAGLIDKGGLLFLAFRGPDWSVQGDEMRDYFLANLSHTVARGHEMLATPVRAVCANTNLLARERSTIQLSIPHSKAALDRIRLAGDLVAQFKRMSADMQAAFDALARRSVTVAEVRAIFDAAFPDPTLPADLRLFRSALAAAEQGALENLMGSRFAAIAKAQQTYDSRVEAVQRLRDAAAERYDVFDPPALRGTAWAAYNAVTEIADWREGRNAARASVWGGRAQEKTRAFAAAIALCN